jgi:ATP-dependent RNA helicase DHX40
MEQVLPIANFREALIDSVVKNDCVIVTGETGCGKTTQLPRYLYEAGLSGDGVIGVTQPRRVAALSVATRVAEETESRLGSLVGYQVRFDDCTSRETKIKYLTDGCLLREFLDDPSLSKYSVVILDEAHERSLSTDILFGLIRRLHLAQKSSNERRKIKIVIMSATLDSGKFSAFFDNCPVFEIPGRVYPVEVCYCLRNDEFDQKKLTYMSHVSRIVMEIHLEEKAGDILVFLTGQKEIESMCDRLFKAAENIDYSYDVQCKSVKGLMVLPLYGSMPTEQQKRVFVSGPHGVRRVIVSTNIAATSLTVDGIVYVVDSGFVKQSSYNSRTGLDSLVVVPIAKSEAKQRAGRAGRTAPGKCYRLYSEAFHSSMLQATVPEIQRTSLTSVMLDLKCMGINNVIDFHYLDPPEERMILEALKQLYYYQCIDKEGRVTSLGRQVVQYPLQPSLARVAIRSKQLACSEAVLPIIAMLSVEEMFIQPPGKKQGEVASEIHKEIISAAGGTSDFATLLAVYQMCMSAVKPHKWCQENFVHWRSLKLAQNIVTQLEGIVNRQDILVDAVSVDSCGSLSERVRCSLCYGLFNNVARSAPGRWHFRTMDGHCTTAYIHPGSALFGKQDHLDWVLYHELVDTAKPYMRTVCPVKYAWIKDLLPLLHRVDAYELSGCARQSPPSPEEPTAKRAKNNPETDGKISLEEGQTKMGRKEEVEVKKAAARERYMQRKIQAQS